MPCPQNIKKYLLLQTKAESTFKIFKTEFINNNIFNTLNELEVELTDYINWFNNHRIHSTLGYLSPIEFLKNKL